MEAVDPVDLGEADEARERVDALLPDAQTGVGERGRIRVLDASVLAVEQVVERAGEVWEEQWQRIRSIGDGAAPPESRHGIALAREPGEVAMLPFRADLSGEMQRRVETRALVRRRPRRIPPLERVEERLHRRGIAQRRERGEGMTRARVEELERRRTVGGRVDRMMRRFSKRSRVGILPVLQDRHPIASFGRMLGEPVQRPEQVGGVGRAVRVRAAIPRRSIRRIAREACVDTRRAERVTIEDRDGPLEKGARVERPSRLAVSARFHVDRSWPAFPSRQGSP